MPEDPEEIADTDELYRLVFPDHVRRDGTISAVAFMRGRHPDPQVSVNVARLTSVEQTLAPKAGRGHHLGVILAGQPRRIGLAVTHDPIPPDDSGGRPENFAHALIIGAASKTHCAQLAEMVRLTKHRA